jgi:PAS domain S-box-containing protein
VFESLFERSEDAIWLYDPQAGMLVDCNQAAIKLIGAENKQQFLPARPEEISPPAQLDGLPSAEKATQIVAAVEKQKGHRFEWLIRRLDGREVPLEVTSTAVVIAAKTIHISISRDVSERKKAERELRELNESLERRVTERTAALTTSEEALREANRELHREIAQRTRAEESLNERVRISTLNTEVALALNAAAGPRDMLQQCAELIVRHLEVALARVWLLNEATQTLELQASAGCYTRLDGGHSRVRVGQHQIGLIAQEKKPHLTNSLQTDPRVTDKQWAAREGMVAFAGYPLLLEGRVLGVLALFARRALPEDILKAVGSVADSIALGIERKRAQTALAESEARFNIAFQASPVFISMFRVSDETYVLANDALLSWLGGTREEVLGRTSGQLGMWENPAEREGMWRDLRTGCSIRQKECRWRNRRGDLSTVLLSAETITIAHEPHVLSLVLDISQRKNAEVEILKALAREKELSQLKSNFVSMVSHEFRTPLGIIQSSAELLHDFLQKMEPEERQAQLGSIFRNTRRMAGMMEEILVLSRLDAGKLDYKPAAMDLAVFCSRTVDEVLSATNRLCPIELFLASDLPSARADERLLSHILTNLLSNAVKYSEPGVAVRLDVAREGTKALFVVSDSGIGISDNDQQMLFSAFHRGANVGNRAGTGLGLLLVKRCVELHHGKVRIESKIGAGTTVTVRLPVFETNL